MILKLTIEERNELDLHLKVAKHGQDELLLHPIMQASLDIKWKMFSRSYWLMMFFDLAFAIILTLVGSYFVSITHCHNCTDIEEDWYMKKFFCENITSCPNGCIKNGLRCENGIIRYGVKKFVMAPSSDEFLN